MKRSLLIILFSAILMAHPGHDEPGLMHYLTSPIHVIPTLAAIALLATYIYKKRQKESSHENH